MNIKDVDGDSKLFSRIQRVGDGESPISNGDTAEDHSRVDRLNLSVSLYGIPRNRERI